MTDFPHETLPTEQLTLKDFTVLMQAASHDPIEYINTALCGRILVDGVPHRASLNARQGLDHPSFPEFTRDFDSAIGITDDLPYTSPFNVYPIANFRDTLTKQNHVRGHIHLPNVSSSSLLLSLPLEWLIVPFRGKKCSSLSTKYPIAPWVPSAVDISQGYSFQCYTPTMATTTQL